MRSPFLLTQRRRAPKRRGRSPLGAAIQARVLDERPYLEIASELGTSETAVRMRVSRGLASLRRRLRNAR